MAWTKSQEIELITEPKALKNRALYWVSKRDYSLHDFYQKLDKVCEIDEMKHSLVEEFVRQGWLNEERYISAFVRSKIAAGLGLFRIKNDIKSHGVKPEKVVELTEHLEVDWFAQALSTYQRKYGNRPADDFKEQNKRFRYMQYRGFSVDEIKYSMSHSEESDWD